MLCSSCFSLVCSGHGRRLLVFTTLLFLKILEQLRIVFSNYSNIFERIDCHFYALQS